MPPRGSGSSASALGICGLYDDGDEPSKPVPNSLAETEVEVQVAKPPAEKQAVEAVKAILTPGNVVPYT
ncbi:MAG: hypothetical protein ACK56I_37420, partial [bacterium]